MPSLSQPTVSRYTLYHTLADLGFNPLRIALAVEALMGPEPELESDPEPDWDEYAQWSRWQDCLEAAHPRYTECDARAAGLAI